MICFKLYRTYSNQTLSIRQMLVNVFWVFIVKDCIEVQEKKKKKESRCLVFTFSTKRGLRPHFHVPVVQ